ncbi:MAG: PilZ domain-containing protein [Phycisphaerales bacterium JB038]
MKQQLNAERRVSDRYAVQNLICDAGTLVDLSPEGACLERHTAWPVGTVRLVTIRSEQEQIRIEAECVHSELPTPERYRLGLRFASVDAADRQVLERLATRHAGY